MKCNFLKSIMFFCVFGITNLSGSLFGVDYLLNPHLGSIEYWENYEDTVADYYDTFPAGKISEIEMQKHIDLNLIWLGKEAVVANKYVFPEFREHLEVVPYIEDWVAKGYKVKFWFDSRASIENQVSNTLKLFQSIKESLGLEESRLELADIWTVESVQEKSDFFTNESGIVPIYLRADLIRLMISLDQIQKGSHYSVYADLDVKAVPLCNLMDKSQQELLNAIGMVVARGGSSYDMENAFHVVKNTKEVETALTLIIDANFSEYQDKNDFYKKDSAQQVYSSYPALFRTLFFLNELGEYLTEDNIELDREAFFEGAIRTYILGNGRVGYNHKFAPKFKFIDSDKIKNLYKLDLIADLTKKIKENKDQSKLIAGKVHELGPLHLELDANRREIDLLKEQLKAKKIDKKIGRSQLRELKKVKSNLSKEIEKEIFQLGNYDSFDELLETLTSLKDKLQELNSEIERLYHDHFDVSFFIPKVTIVRPPSKSYGYD